MSYVSWSTPSQNIIYNPKYCAGCVITSWTNWHRTDKFSLRVLKRIPAGRSVWLSADDRVKMKLFMSRQTTWKILKPDVWTCWVYECEMCHIQSVGCVRTDCSWAFCNQNRCKLLSAVSIAWTDDSKWWQTQQKCRFVGFFCVIISWFSTTQLWQTTGLNPEETTAALRSGWWFSVGRTGDERRHRGFFFLPAGVWMRQNKERCKNSRYIRELGEVRHLDLSHASQDLNQVEAFVRLEPTDEEEEKVKRQKHVAFRAPSPPVTKNQIWQPCAFVFVFLKHSSLQDALDFSA